MTQNPKAGAETPDEVLIGNTLARKIGEQTHPADPTDEVAYWRAREAEERDQAAASSCMARTAHEDMADDYADRVRAVEDTKE